MTNNRRSTSIRTHLVQAKAWISSPMVTMLTFPQDTTERDVSRFRKNLREKICYNQKKSKTKFTKNDPRKCIVFTLYHEDSKDKRRHYHALISVSCLLAGHPGRLHALIDPVWQNIKPETTIHISSHYHRDLHSNEENIYNQLTYLDKDSQRPEMEHNKKSFSSSHWRFLHGFEDED